MPLDRPITIGIRGPDDTNAAGQFVPGAVELYPVFATALDISVQRVLETGGARLDSDRVFRVRWFEELAIAPVTSIELADELALCLPRYQRLRIRGALWRFEKALAGY